MLIPLRALAPVVKLFIKPLLKTHWDMLLLFYFTNEQLARLKLIFFYSLKKTFTFVLPVNKFIKIS